MNYQQKCNEYKRIKGLLLNNFPEGCIKITSQESYKHASVKTMVAHYMKCQGFEVYSEANFKDAGRCDLICINRRGFFYIIEIVDSESKKSIERKKEKYPGEVIVVDAKTFNYGEFKI